MLDSAQVFENSLGGGIALLGIFGDHVRDDRGQRTRHILERRRFLMNDTGDGGGEAVAVERLLAAEHFIEDQAEGENIGAAVVGLLQQAPRAPCRRACRRRRSWSPCCG